jgi:hypothetical protein
MTPEEIRRGERVIAKVMNLAGQPRFSKDAWAMVDLMKWLSAQNKLPELHGFGEDGFASLVVHETLYKKGEADTPQMALFLAAIQLPEVQQHLTALQGEVSRA